MLRTHQGNAPELPPTSALRAGLSAAVCHRIPSLPLLRAVKSARSFSVAAIKAFVPLVGFGFHLAEPPSVWSSSWLETESVLVPEHGGDLRRFRFWLASSGDGGAPSVFRRFIFVRSAIALPYPVDQRLNSASALTFRLRTTGFRYGMAGILGLTIGRAFQQTTVKHGITRFSD